MLNKLTILLAIVMITILSGCGAESSSSKVINEYVEVVTEMVGILNSLKTEDEAKKATPKFNKLYKRMSELMDDMKNNPEKDPEKVLEGINSGMGLGMAMADLIQKPKVEAALKEAGCDLYN